MRNQFGQDIKVGDVVGHVTRSGSSLYRKVGEVVAFSERKQRSGTIPTVKVKWTHDESSWSNSVGKISPGVGVNTVFKLDPASLES